MSGPVQHAGMRASNLALVLRAIAEADAITRARLSTVTGLTKSSISGLVTDLVAGGLVEETLAPPSRDRGRPGTMLALHRQGVAGLGLEVNVDYLAALVVDLGGTVRYRHVATRDNRGRPAQEVLAELAGLAEAATAAAAEQRLGLAGACLAVPGAADGTTIVRAPNLEWAVVPVELPLPATAYGLSIENEANLAALGELWFGTATPRDFVHVSGEIGIGAGIVVGGELFRGAHLRAGELGHVILDPDGPPCSCGGRGCLERLAGLDAILQAAGAPSRLELERRCRDGDDRALGAVADAGRLVGVALASVTNLLDPDAVVLGGVFAALAPWLQPAVADALADHAAKPELLVSSLGPDAAVRGAAGAVVRQVIDDPAKFLGWRG
ncbi:ROK family transcriptional regulator [Nocardioides sp. BP30]|uniref:ROK family transcriptional regulator n=1 Tax=Nocardioides sp. BP30 TaxID=3036374 RepID=UPI002468A727|nr:ROK family transcriptional regulator [Nocardioides sp. BP30]WGL52410.1 ROK family transcriptional regulator [Nocardioides sp. BP30]